MPTKVMPSMTAEEQELQELISEFSLRRVIKILRSRKKQLERQRTSEYRDQQAARTREAREADKRRILELERSLAELRGRPRDFDEEEGEHAA